MNRLSFSLLVALLLSLNGCSSLKTANPLTLPPGRVMKIRGHNIFVRQTGSGPDVVLLHGLGDSSVGWQSIESALVRAGYRVTVWDALGAGRSDKPANGDYRIQAHVERLENLLEAVQIQEAVVVGHSLGGSEALRLAEWKPARVSALCLIDPAAYRAGAMGGRWFWKAPLFAKIVLGILPARVIARFGLKQNFHNRAGISKQLETTYVREAKRAGAKAALIAQERQLVPAHPEQWEAAHRTIRVPTLILWGREDKLVPVAQGKRLAKDIKGSRLVVFPGVGHSPQLESPQLALGQLLLFLEKVTSRRRSTKKGDVERADGAFPEHD